MGNLEVTRKSLEDWVLEVFEAVHDDDVCSNNCTTHESVKVLKLIGFSSFTVRVKCVVAAAFMCDVVNKMSYGKDPQTHPFPVLELSNTRLFLRTYPTWTKQFSTIFTQSIADGLPSQNIYILLVKS